MTWVRYHSAAWEILVETGWATVRVDDDGLALMIKVRP